jgi:hypothetical protein
VHLDAAGADASQLAAQEGRRRLRGKPTNINWGQPIIVENFSGSSLNRSLWDVEIDCWGAGNGEAGLSNCSFARGTCGHACLLA